MPEPVPSILVGGSIDEPFVLAGPPGELTGRIQVRNPGDVKVVLRDAGLKDPSGVLALPSSRHVLQTVVLQPDQGGSIPLSVAIDPSTPPGEYRAELNLVGQTRPVLLQVTEFFHLKVLPRSLVVINQPDLRQTKQLVITNDGNVAFTIADSARVDLWNDSPRDRVIRVVIEPSPVTDNPDFQALVVALRTALADEHARLGSLEVSIPGGPVEVHPGETQAVELEITVPQELPPDRRYRGQLPILTADLDIFVVASAAAVPKQKSPRSRRRPANTKSAGTEGATL